MTRLGIMGGTFDPVHLGHLIVASFAAGELGLDRILFIPAQAPPHKRGRDISDTPHRVAMVKAAIARDSRFEFSDMDLLTVRPSYTSDLLERLHDAEPDASLFFIIGADSLRDFPKWYEPERILTLATLAVAARPGVSIDESTVDALPDLRQRTALFSSPLVDISSTMIRARVAAGEPVTWLVPPEVETYIREHNLFSRKPSNRHHFQSD